MTLKELWNKVVTAEDHGHKGDRHNVQQQVDKMARQTLLGISKEPMTVGDYHAMTIMLGHGAERGIE